MTGFGTIPSISTPFGISDVCRQYPRHEDAAATGSNATLLGIGDKLAAPGGGPFTRHHINGIGYLATLGGFLQQAGYQATFDNAPLGGWPRGAIVCDIVNTSVKEYVNTGDSAAAVDRTVETDARNVESWHPIWSYEQFNFFPNYDDRKVVFSRVANANNPIDQEVLNDNRGWYLITRTYDDWDEMDDARRTRLDYQDDLHIRMDYMYYSFSTDQFTIPGYEGRVASRIFPCSGKLGIRMSPSANAGNVTISVVKFGMEDIR